MKGAGRARQGFAAIVLAGSRTATDPIAAAHGLAFKCLVPVGGVPMVVRVVRALIKTERIGKIALVGDLNLTDGFSELTVLREAGRLIAVPAATSPSLSVAAALDVLGTWPVLVTTADHPLLTPDLIDRFLDGATVETADLAAGLTPSAAILARFPESRRTFWRFRDERYSGANLFALLTPQARLVVRFWRKVEAERKRPWRIARLFGLRPLLAYLFGRLTLAEAMVVASGVIGTKVIAVSLAIAEAAIDVDKPEDLVLVERILAQQRAA